MRHPAYRPRILRQLQSLSISEALDDLESIRESDIFSSNAQPMASTAEVPLGDGKDPMDIDNVVDEPEESPYRSILDSKKGVFRDTARVEYGYLALVITRDSVGTLMQSFKDDRQAKKFVRGVMAALDDDTVELTGLQLSEIQNLWTAERHQRSSLIMASQTFFTRLTFATHLTQDWDITKQLFCLAVTKDALHDLMRQSGRKREREFLLCPFVWENLKELLVRLRYARPSWNLSSAISRVGLRVAGIGPDVIKNASERGQWELAPGSRGKDGLPVELTDWYGFRLTSAPDAIQQRFNEVYKIHKIGRREPDETFIQRSLQIDKQPTPFHGPIPFNSQTPEAYTITGNLCVVEQAVPSELSTSNFCLYRVADHDARLTRTEAQMFLESRLSPHTDIYWTERYWRDRVRSHPILNLSKQHTQRKSGSFAMLRIKRWIDYLRELTTTEETVFAAVGSQGTNLGLIVID